MRGNSWSAPTSRSSPLSRSCSSAGWTCTRRMSPSVSTSRCRLRPCTFFPPAEAALATGFGGLDALRVDDRRARLALAADLLAQPLAQDGVDALQRPVLGPPIEVVADGLPWPILPRDLPPLAAGPPQVQQPVEDAPSRDRRPPPSALGLRQQRFQHRPLGLGQVAGVVHGGVGGLHASPPAAAAQMLQASGPQTLCRLARLTQEF